MKKFVQIKRTLVSVSNKEKLEELGRCLLRHNIEIISSGGTAKFLEEKGIKTTPVKEVTGNPEAFGGRMKTLSFQISSSLLYRRSHPSDIEEAKELSIEPIDLVICNLYPFQDVLKRKGPLDEMIENIDIGGPTMIRSAAKNYSDVCVATKPDQYEELFKELDKNKGSVDIDLRKKFSLEAFRHTAFYDGMIARALEEEFEEETFTISLSPEHASALRYGENPHQRAHLYKNPNENGLAQSVPIQGKAMSYNNLLDADAALKCTSDLNSLTETSLPFAVSIIKHLNPCGAAVGKDFVKTLDLAWKSDPISAFGSIICFNQTVTEEVALWFDKKFIEVILAPSFTQEALAVFSKKKNLRILKVDMLDSSKRELITRSISGGHLVQDEDQGQDQEIQSMTKRALSNEHMNLAQFGIYLTKHFKSNAISLVQNTDNGPALIGAGMGNPNRLVSLIQATEKARENGHSDLGQALLVSDAFFPFKDTVEAAHKEGVTSIIQPGGSIKDKDVLECANELNISMAFTGRRHFRH